MWHGATRKGNKMTITTAQRTKLLELSERFSTPELAAEVVDFPVDDTVTNDGVGAWYGRTDTYKGIYIVVLTDGSSHS